MYKLCFITFLLATTVYPSAPAASVATELTTEITAARRMLDDQKAQKNKADLPWNKSEEREWFFDTALVRLRACEVEALGTDSIFSKESVDRKMRAQIDARMKSEILELFTFYARNRTHEKLWEWASGLRSTIDQQIYNELERHRETESSFTKKEKLDQYFSRHLEKILSEITSDLIQQGK
jgi:hypothetical protein